MVKCAGCDRVQEAKYDPFYKHNGKLYCRRCHEEIHATINANYTGE